VTVVGVLAGGGHVFGAIRRCFELVPELSVSQNGDIRVVVLVIVRRLSVVLLVVVFGLVSEPVVDVNRSRRRLDFDLLGRRHLRARGVRYHPQQLLLVGSAVVGVRGQHRLLVAVAVAEDLLLESDRLGPDAGRGHRIQTDVDLFRVEPDIRSARDREVVRRDHFRRRRHRRRREVLRARRLRLGPRSGGRGGGGGGGRGLDDDGRVGLGVICKSSMTVKPRPLQDSPSDKDGWVLPYSSRLRL
jgi:hypothetical protein